MTCYFVLRRGVPTAWSTRKAGNCGPLSKTPEALADDGLPRRTYPSAGHQPRSQRRGSPVDNAVPEASAAPPASSPPPPRRPGAGMLLTLVNGVLAGVASVYVGSHSVLITVIAGITAVLLAAMTLMFPRS